MATVSIGMAIVRVTALSAYTYWLPCLPIRTTDLVMLLENLREGHVVEVDVVLEPEERLLASQHLGTLQP